MCTEDFLLFNKSKSGSGNYLYNRFAFEIIVHYWKHMELKSQQFWGLLTLASDIIWNLKLEFMICLKMFRTSRGVLMLAKRTYRTVIDFAGLCSGYAWLPEMLENISENLIILKNFIKLKESDFTLLLSSIQNE